MTVPTVTVHFRDEQEAVYDRLRIVAWELRKTPEEVVLDALGPHLAKFDVFEVPG